MSEDELRLERRAKMKELQRTLDPSTSREEVMLSSAPSVRQVDQFKDSYGMADRMRKASPPPTMSQKARRHFQMGGGQRRTVRILMETKDEEGHFCPHDALFIIYSLFGRPNCTRARASKMAATT